MTKNEAIVVLENSLEVIESNGYVEITKAFDALDNIKMNDYDISDIRRVRNAINDFHLVDSGKGHFNKSGIEVKTINSALLTLKSAA